MISIIDWFRQRLWGISITKHSKELLRSGGQRGYRVSTRLLARYTREWCPGHRALTAVLDPGRGRRACWRWFIIKKGLRKSFLWNSTRHKWQRPLIWGSTEPETSIMGLSCNSRTTFRERELSPSWMHRLTELPWDNPSPLVKLPAILGQVHSSAIQTAGVATLRKNSSKQTRNVTRAEITYCYPMSESARIQQSKAITTP